MLKGHGYPDSSVQSPQQADQPAQRTAMQAAAARTAESTGSDIQTALDLDTLENH